ncbi:MAG: Ig-like domain-containing protein [Gemmatimonadaceae bacterium]|nr:Ig-like domain-containing protein [Gemmatimonadaceae bacterium]
MPVRLALISATLAALAVAQPPQAMTALTVSPANATLVIGGSQWFEARARAVASARVRHAYVVYDTTIAQVDSTGLVSARATGSTRMQVTARAEADGYSASVLTAEVPVVVAVR